MTTLFASAGLTYFNWLSEDDDLIGFHVSQAN